MAQPQPDERVTLDQVLKLVDKLSPDEQEQLWEQMKLQHLKRDLQKGIGSLRRGEGILAENVLRKLEARAQKRLDQQKSRGQ